MQKIKLIYLKIKTVVKDILKKHPIMKKHLVKILSISLRVIEILSKMEAAYKSSMIIAGMGSMGVANYMVITGMNSELQEKINKLTDMSFRFINRASDYKGVTILDALIKAFTKLAIAIATSYLSKIARLRLQQ